LRETHVTSCFFERNTVARFMSFEKGGTVAKRRQKKKTQAFRGAYAKKSGRSKRTQKATTEYLGCER